MDTYLLVVKILLLVPRGPGQRTEPESFLHDGCKKTGFDLDQVGADPAENEQHVTDFS